MNNWLKSVYRRKYFQTWIPFKGHIYYTSLPFHPWRPKCACLNDSERRICLVQLAVCGSSSGRTVQEWRNVVGETCNQVVARGLYSGMRRTNIFIGWEFVRFNKSASNKCSCQIQFVTRSLVTHTHNYTSTGWWPTYVNMLKITHQNSVWPRTRVHVCKYIHTYM